MFFSFYFFWKHDRKYNSLYYGERVSARSKMPRELWGSLRRSIWSLWFFHIPCANEYPIFSTQQRRVMYQPIQEFSCENYSISLWVMRYRINRTAAITAIRCGILLLFSFFSRKKCNPEKCKQTIQILNHQIETLNCFIAVEHNTKQKPFMIYMNEWCWAGEVDIWNISIQL